MLEKWKRITPELDDGHLPSSSGVGVDETLPVGSERKWNAADGSAVRKKRWS
jgi:hypothetical protein